MWFKKGATIANEYIFGVKYQGNQFLHVFIKGMKDTFVVDMETKEEALKKAIEVQEMLEEEENIEDENFEKYADIGEEW